jgi:hypothetical protein
MSVGLDCEAQLRQMSDKTMSNRKKTFTWTRLLGWIYRQDYLTGSICSAPIAREGSGLAICQS